MPVFYEEEDPGYPAPPPNAPPPAGTVGPAGPVIGLPPGTPEAPAGPSGGGGGGGSPLPPTLPGLPGFNIPGAPVFAPPKFNAPNAQTLLSDPGYLARLNTANTALERSAAARGTLRGGNTLNDIVEQSQNFGSQEYDAAYRRARDTFDTDYRSAYDMFAPQLAAWKLKAEGLGGMQRDRYSAELNHWLSSNAPRGGGGGGGMPDLGDIYGDLGPPPALFPPSGGGPTFPGGSDPYNDTFTPMAYGAGDPWTDPDTYNAY